MAKKDDPHIPPVSDIKYRPHNGGPWAVMALFCDYFLEEKNTGVPSLIRIVDRFELQSPPSTLRVVDESGTELSASAAAMIRTTFVIHLASDATRGSHQVTLRVEGPDGLIQDIPGGPKLHFEGEERGIRIALPLEFAVAEAGLYWFEVLVDGRIVTRTPLRVIFR